LPVDGGSLAALMQKLELDVLAVAGVPFLLLMLAAIGGNMIQHRLVWSAEQLRPALSKISPLAGAKRLFSKFALVNFATGLVKLAPCGALMLGVIWPERNRLDALVSTDVGAVLVLTQALTGKLLGAVVAALAVIAALDYLFQYRQWYERQKMSIREMRE